LGSFKKNNGGIFLSPSSIQLQAVSIHIYVFNVYHT
jgi:hypothetical protein